jgi:transglutaminase-like putative cysteine protease
MRLSILHETKYRYATPANYSIQYLRLSPPTTPQQNVLAWKLDLPAPARSFTDGYGNAAHVLVVDRPHQELRIRARGEVEVADAPFVLSEAGPHHPEIYLRSTELTAQDADLAAFAEGFRPRIATDVASGLDEVMGAIRDRVAYQPGATLVTTTAAEVFARGAGVCQDHAHVFLACCRQLGIPARYVSGYLAPRDKTNGDGQPRELASHAWAEAWITGVGWQSYDVANRARAHGRHVRVAVGLDYLDACPIRGFHRGGGGEVLGVEVRINEASTSTVTEPLAEASKPDEMAKQQQQQAQQ